MLIHIVKSGDTLTSISKEYGVSVSRLIFDNGLTANQQLVVGQALIVLLPTKVYTVRPGDTLQTIARVNSTTVINLLQNNPFLSLSKRLTAGEQLAIFFRGKKKRSIAVNGYAYSFITPQLLEYSLPFLTFLSIFSYGFKESGELISIDDEFMIRLAYRYKVAPVMVLTTIDENGNFSSDKASALLNDLVYQNKVLDNIVAVMLDKGYLGLDIDFEFITPEDADAYISFLKNARTKMSSYGFLLSSALAPKTSATQRGILYEAHNYPLIAEQTDYVFLMTYEWGYAYGPPLAVAPINQVRSVVDYAVTEMPTSGIQLGIPNYAYDWTLPYKKGASRANTIGNQEAVIIAADNNAEIEFDKVSMSPDFEYYKSGKKHIVWFEDVRSIEAKFNLADEFLLGGIGYWNLTRPFAQNWSLISTRYNIKKLY